MLNLTSNRLATISGRVIIFSVISLTKLYNVLIIGSKNHSIICINNAGLQLEQCSNITIEGLNWVGCGADNTPVINILDSTNITLQNCLFQRSKGRAVMLFESSGDVNINHCQFMNNIEYRGHGAAIHYSSNDATNSQLTLVIINCSFTHNEGAISLVHINGQTENTNISLYNSSFHNNHGISVYLSSNTTLHINGEVLFENNVAENGAGIYVNDFSKVVFDNNSIVKFANNSVSCSGAAIFLKDYSSVLFDHNFVVTFSNNSATQYGAAIYSSNNSQVAFMGISNVEFNDNIASVHGGSVYSEYHSFVSFKDNSTVAFHTNIGYIGGAILSHNKSIINFGDHSTVLFNNNEARNSGGAIFSNNSAVTIKSNANAKFESNNAMFGGALCLNSNATISFKNSSIALFKNNKATNDGGAINIQTNSNIMVKDNATLTFITNNAQYGGAMFFDATHTTLQISNNKTNISFISNTASIAGDNMYFELTGSNGSCVSNRISETQYVIATPPNKLKFFDPATCIDYDNNTAECNTYYLKHIMLGEEINIPVCILNSCNQPSYSTIRFVLRGENNQTYSIDISGSNQVLLSCNETFQGISIIGIDSLSKSSNYTINILHNDLNPVDWKQIFVNLTIELTPCHPGFWQYSGSKKCECYNANDIVFCTGSNSTIKRGYWFGNVTGKPTVTFCPINYCDFTCCEASNGYYHLSPVRDNQCRSHRSGTACGSCTDGYTLSFDSPECVNVDSCTTGQTVLVILLTVTYWIVMVTLVFAMMYYKVPIGYLYSITYYYSVVDILLSENLQASRGLYLTVSIMSSFSKITPQFLGELCLTTGLSGIDQYFIHYIHPSAVILILVIISLSARSSRRISAFISRGIIHVICLLLLLSYTSIASTSLLLMRPLPFHEIDKMYTYLSPDIEYFHDRHLAYGIVALLCTIIIAVGLPLLLTLEPFLNRKINFAKIKPLLDQFQGCYKDKFRCFAGYYMICRLVIITIVIANSSNEFVASYLLIVACGVIALIHVTARPYNNEIINKFDGMILLLVIFITALPLLDDFNSPLPTSVVFVLVLLPLLTLTAIALFLHKDDIKKIAECFTFKDKALTNGIGDNISVHNKEVPMKEFDFIVDDSARNNTNITVCDM